MGHIHFIHTDRTHVFELIQTQWTLVAQLVIRQTGKWCRAEGGTDEKWNLSSYSLSLVIPLSSLSLFLSISHPSVVWRTPADVGLSLELRKACGAIFFLLIIAHSPMLDTTTSWIKSVSHKHIAALVNEKTASCEDKHTHTHACSHTGAVRHCFLL